MIRPLFAVAGLTLLSVVGLRTLGYGASGPLPPAELPLDACSRVVRGISALDLKPAWDSLPGAWQADLDGLVDKLEEGANPDLWARSFSLMQRLDLFLREQPDLVCASPRLGTLTGVPEGASEEGRRQHLERIRSRAISLLTTVTESGLDDPDNLAYFDLREIAGAFLPTVEEELRSLPGHEDDTLIDPELARSLASLAAELAGDTTAQLPYANGSMAVPVGAGSQVYEVYFTRIDGSWCDASLAASWGEMIASATQRIEAWTVKTQSGDLDFARGLLSTLEAGMEALEAAGATDSSAAMDEALDTTTGKIGALIIGQKLKAMMK
jgi:hypothetical protein